MARKSHQGRYFEADKALLYDHLDKALTGGPLESALQPHETTKDGQAVMKSIEEQHGVQAKWEALYDELDAALNTKWKCSGNITLTKHISNYRENVTKLVKCCKNTTHSPPTEREKVLRLKSLIETVSHLLQAHIAKVNSDPNGLGNNFEDCATHLMIADPVVVKKSKSNKRVNVAAAAFIGKCPDTGVEYRFHSDEEFAALT